MTRMGNNNINNNRNKNYIFLVYINYRETGVK